MDKTLEYQHFSIAELGAICNNLQNYGSDFMTSEYVQILVQSICDYVYQSLGSDFYDMWIEEFQIEVQRRYVAPINYGATGRCGLSILYEVSMQISLSEMSINNSAVHSRLIEYLDKVKIYQNFDENMMLRVFVNNDKDFTAFEAENYRIQFTSYDHKLIETINSGYPSIRTSFKTFYDAVLGLKS